MSLFSLFRKNKQETSAEDSAYISRVASESSDTKPRKRKSSTNADGEKSPVDPVLPEKKRARRRLVGATALVVAVVIGLPMVLDSEPKPLPDDLTIDIPSKDQPAVPARAAPEGATTPAPATTPTPTLTAVVPPRIDSAGASASVATVAALDPKEEVIQLPVTPKTVAPTISTAAPGIPKKAEPTPAKPAARSKTEPAVTVSSEKAADSARAKAILEADNDTKPAKLTLQVAALASPEKVNELRGKLKGAGIASYTQKIATDSGERIIRIRIGPLNSREEADKMRAKLVSLGLSGTLVASTQ